MKQVMKQSYRLLITPRSPFARRVRIALLRHGIPFETEVVDPMNPTEALLAKNPLGLIPVLEGAGIDPLMDSSMILDYLDRIHAPLWPKEPIARVAALSASALASGVMTAAVSYLFETQKASPDSGWMQDYEDSIRRAFAELDRRLARSGLYLEDGEVTQAGWDLGVALEYASLRCPGVNWRQAHPGLGSFLEGCRKKGFFAETTPPPPV